MVLRAAKMPSLQEAGDDRIVRSLDVTLKRADATAENYAREMLYELGLDNSLITRFNEWLGADYVAKCAQAFRQQGITEIISRQGSAANVTVTISITLWLVNAIRQFAGQKALTLNDKGVVEGTGAPGDSKRVNKSGRRGGGAGSGNQSGAGNQTGSGKRKRGGGVVDTSSPEFIRATQALRNVEAQAAQFGLRFISDAKVRRNYTRLTARYTKYAQRAMESGTISAREAAERASAMRNTLVDAMRLKSSDIGRAIAEKQKPATKAFAWFCEHYAKEMFGKEFGKLSEKEVFKVYHKIVERSGAPNQAFTAKAARYGKLGKVCIFVTIGIAVFNIAVAEDKVDATKREGVSVLGGMAGGALVGAGAGLLCGPGAPVCVTVGVFVGGVLGAIGAEYLYEWSKTTDDKKVPAGAL